MAKQKKGGKGCGVFMAIMAVLILLGGGAVFCFEAYKKQQEKIAEEIKELAAFDAEAAKKEAAAELNIELPVKAPTMTREQVKDQAEEELKELSKKKVPSTFLSLKTSDILKKYRPAKKGEQVSFLIFTTGKTIKGPYKGTGSDNKGKYIKVGWNKYRLYDIDEERMYLFDPVIAQKRATTEIAGLKREYKEKRQKVISENREKVQEKIYVKAGYQQLDGEWQPNADILEAKIEEKEQGHRSSLKTEITRIYERNKLFGLIDVKLPEDEGESEPGNFDEEDDDDEFEEEEFEEE